LWLAVCFMREFVKHCVCHGLKWRVLQEKNGFAGGWVEKDCRPLKKLPVWRRRRTLRVGVERMAWGQAGGGAFWGFLF